MPRPDDAAIVRRYLPFKRAANLETIRLLTLVLEAREMVDVSTAKALALVLDARKAAGAAPVKKGR